MAKSAIRALSLVALLAATPVLAETDAGDGKPDLVNEPDQGLIAAALSAATPETLAPGLAYRLARLDDFGLAIHVWAVDPARYGLRLAEQKAETGSLIEAFLDRPADVFAINGGFFERDDETKVLSPSGLLVIDGTVVTPEHERAGSGVVYADADGIHIVYRKDAPPPSAMTEALQVGPVLVDPGGKLGIYKNNHKRDDRSAICLPADGPVLVVAVDGGLSLYQFAVTLAASPSDGGLGCDIALNLDGGPSTQALFRSGDRRIEVTGDWPVENALVFYEKSP